MKNLSYTSKAKKQNDDEPGTERGLEMTQNDKQEKKEPDGKKGTVYEWPSDILPEMKTRLEEFLGKLQDAESEEQIQALQDLCKPDDERLIEFMVALRNTSRKEF